ncbi:hypothetical protein [Caenispirillum bisanense]|uniref:hypothetical protein n=1 Tax=Caenispirillum bisanense TaxID=414052 RepID=UPI00114484BE|nr:hypothetical protein [Caenispirillum bisanense]
MSEEQKRRPRSRSQDPRKFARFIEELHWLLESNRDIDFKYMLKPLLSPENHSNTKSYRFDEFMPDNPNKQMLVGVLPVMFSDERLFPNNEDIADFSATVLNAKIPRWEKKSKYEIIGHIVCHTAEADDQRLEKIARALSKIASGSSGRNYLIAASRIEKKGWNEIIQELIGETKDDGY